MCDVPSAVIVVSRPVFSSSATQSLCAFFPSHNAEQPHDPLAEGQSRRLAEQSPLAGYEPNATVEVSSAEVTPVLPPSRRASFCTVYNSGEDVTTTLVSSEVDEKQNMENVGFTAAHAEERSKCTSLQQVSTQKEKVLCLAFLTFKPQGDLLRCTHTNGNRAETQETHGDTFRKRKNTDRA